MNTLSIFCNMIPLLLVVYYMVDGWSKGGLYMFISLIRLIASYLIARFLSSFFASYMMSQPAIRTQISSAVLNNKEALTKLPGMSLLLTGHALESTLEAAAYWVLFALSFIVCFIIVMVVFAVILKLTLASNKIPVVGFFNRLIGLLEGGIFGILFTLLLVYLISFLLNAIGYTDISEALLASWLPVMFRSIV